MKQKPKIKFRADFGCNYDFKAAFCVIRAGAPADFIVPV